MHTSTLSRAKEKSDKLSTLFTPDGDTLQGIVLSLVSPDPEIIDRITEVIGGHFHLEFGLFSENSVSVTIKPKDYCLVDGGMMFRTAGCIITRLLDHGIFIQSMDTILE